MLVSLTDIVYVRTPRHATHPRPISKPKRNKQVPDFVARTAVDLLACTIGNVHGNYAVQPPQLDLPRLEAIRGATDRCVRVGFLILKRVDVDVCESVVL